MTICKVTRAVMTLGLTAGLSVVAMAQEPQKDQPQQRQRTEGSNLTGCLAKGDKADQYVLTDKAGKTTTVTASSAVALEKHAGHTVELTGSNSDGNFVATNVRHIAATCEAKK